MIQAIIASCQKLGIHTLCEGVETEKQYQFVKEAGV
ncbi:MAG TPA: EAL domain-containing protein, partial [Erysipelotrichaceae bacterium]|nr:EAL domain-containing protein [Erysipelotrichaceae bacterium]